jgi:shikimate dehydrogenase
MPAILCAWPIRTQIPWIDIVTTDASSDRFVLAGVMGWPIAHSRSPLLHGFLLKQENVNGAYVPLAIRPEALEAALRALPVLCFGGCNLTIPHKERAMAFVDRIDDAARKIGAINCVTVEEDGSLSATNNDHFGFIQGLLEADPDLAFDAGPIAVIGAGGAARGVVYGLIDHGAREIRLVNRTQERAVALKRDFGDPIEVCPWEKRAEILDGATMLVNTTSQGMSGYPPLELDLDALPQAALVCDIVYVPAETPLLAAARERGNRTVNGLGMLLHQARAAWQSWFGIDPAITPQLRAAIMATL